jgi:hypothetical protein
VRIGIKWPGETEMWWEGNSLKEEEEEDYGHVVAPGKSGPGQRLPRVTTLIFFLKRQLCTPLLSLLVLPAVCRAHARVPCRSLCFATAAHCHAPRTQATIDHAAGPRSGCQPYRLELLVVIGTGPVEE